MIPFFTPPGLLKDIDKKEIFLLYRAIEGDCFNGCVDYFLLILKDGTLRSTFIIDRSVLNLPEFETTKIQEKELRKLKEKIKTFDISSLNKKFKKSIICTDPTKSDLIVIEDDIEKKITWYPSPWIKEINDFTKLTRFLNKLSKFDFSFLDD